MGRIVKLFDSGFATRTPLYLGSRRFDEVSLWLLGYEFACSEIEPTEISDFDGFREWLLMEVGGPGCVGWEGIILEKFGRESEATEQFFILFRRFRAVADQLGAAAIKRQYSQFSNDRSLKKKDAAESE